MDSTRLNAGFIGLYAKRIMIIPQNADDHVNLEQAVNYRYLLKSVKYYAFLNVSF